MNPKVILLDGSAFLFRAYFSTQSQQLISPEGLPTGAMFGVISSIKMLQNKYPDSDMIAIFDHKDKTFRHDIYPKYKANRKPAEAELIKQIEPLYEIIYALGLPFLCIPNVEADDVIATLCQWAVPSSIEMLIASSDKDLYQLIDDTHIAQIDMKGKLMNQQAVYNKLGVYPNQVLDFLALAGDSSDNIPGIPSVGPKTAAKWLQEYGNITTLKKNAHLIKGKIGQKLVDNFDLLDLSYRLITLKKDVTVEIDFDDIVAKPDTVKLKKLYKKYGFKQWLRQIEDRELYSGTNSQTSKSTKNIAANYTQTVLSTTADFKVFLQKLIKAKCFVFDTETTSLEYMDAQLVGLVFLLAKNAYYLPIGHSYLGVPEQLDGLSILKQLKPIFEDKSIAKIGQNIKYDAHILANYNIHLRGIVADTMLASYCLNSVATLHNMDDLAKYYLNHKTIKFGDIAGRGRQQTSIDQIEIKKVAEYACEDVIITNELNQILSKKLKEKPVLEALYQTLEVPLIAVLVAIERNGVLLDTSTLLVQQNTLLSTITQLKKQIYEQTHNEFNLDSPKQLRSILFDANYLNLEPQKTTPRGVASTDEESLKLLNHPIAKLLLEYRGLNKLNSTYLEALPKQINKKTKRIHTSYHQAGTTTGRLSSSNPNLQNIPIKTKEGAKIRQAFIAQNGWQILAADYSQIELRIMAHLSKDTGLTEAFMNGIDVHEATASQMFNKPLAQITPDDRRNAKAINFGLMYGMGAFSLAKQINIKRTEAKTYIERYFANYPQVENFVKSTQQFAKDNGFVQTIKGRRLYLPDIHSKNKAREQHALRLAINAPVQGSSADIIKQAMLDICQYITTKKPPLRLIMQVHDELVFEVENNFIDEASSQIAQKMSLAVPLLVPLPVDIGVGNNWQDAH